MKKATTKKARKLAKKFFAKLPNTTRPFTPADYNALPVSHEV